VVGLGGRHRRRGAPPAVVERLVGREAGLPGRGGRGVGEQVQTHGDLPRETWIALLRAYTSPFAEVLTG
jgi:hypothetical protein